MRKTKSGRTTHGITLTFKPLSGGRYRCHQTGAITKNPRQYRCARMKQGNIQSIKELQDFLEGTKNTRPQPYSRPHLDTSGNRTYNMYGQIRYKTLYRAGCPYCFATNNTVCRGTTHKCTNCSRTFFVTRK